MTRQEVTELKMMNFIDAQSNAKKALKEFEKEMEKPYEQRISGYDLDTMVRKSIAYSLIAITELLRKK